MINVLVTGGNGQLASCIKDIEAKYDDLNFIYTDYQDLDICDLDQVQSFFSDNKIDYCVNCAAYTAVDQAENEIEKAYNINANGAKNLAMVCKEYEAILIHISTDFVFDGNKTEPYTEKDKPNPISVYGASKLQGEVEIQKVLKEHFIIRTSWLYSEYGNNFMRTMLKLSETRDEISVVSDQIGTPTYAGDLAAVIIKIIRIKSKDFGLYHYSNEGAVSWFEFAKAIFDLSKVKIIIKPIKSKDYPVLARRPVYSVLEKSKVKKTLGIGVPYWRDSLVKI
ncbi:dTDP-4-dehydrorhamnose reductase [Aestuariivivens insulae]|uniref:dTDP-4-dehydrorhamnose reductase n=1 Tax=Aestuariivivens insulae TaxID=1621988 RepID=UPI001F5A7B59|nr:dTDP-4-dehydrorhamnose reductase [Aestuariivivens insulae]